ncbi:hypothetical protein GCM10027289_20750 [Tsukamurella serpentis]
MHRFRVVDVGVSTVVFLLVSGLAAGWYGLERAVPTPVTDVSGSTISVGPGAREVEFRAPQGWSRVPTGRAEAVRLVHPTGSTLLVQLTIGLTDFDTAAPRRLRELSAGGVHASFTGDLRAASFSGRACTATAPGRSGECAVLGRDDLLVTVLTLRRPDGAVPDLGVLADSLREA